MKNDCRLVEYWSKALVQTIENPVVELVLCGTYNISDLIFI